MNLQDAMRKADQILDEERQQPSLEYEFVTSPKDSPLAAIALIVGPKTIQNERNERPRKVYEKSFYKLKSANFDLLSILLSHVNEKDRPSFFAYIWSRIGNPKCCHLSGYTNAISWQGIVSELPLIGEFSLRNSDKANFFRCLAETQTLTLGLLLTLMQLEEMLSLNFNILSDKDLETLPQYLFGVRQLADRNLKNQEASWVDGRRHYVETSKIAWKVIEVCESIIEQCRRARYFYLKGALLQETNLEINEDKAAVESYLQSLGFNETLVQSLNHAEELYRSPSPFELKSSMGHLRSFLENLHAEAAQRVAKKASVPAPSTWGANIFFLRQNGIMSQPEEQFLVSLYKLISDQAVHALSAEREYARIARNVVIEYGLVLLSRMDKAGLKAVRKKRARP